MTSHPDTSPPEPRPIRTYEVLVYGYSGALYSARSPAKARWRAYQDFASCWSSVTFHDFLTRSTIRVIPNPPGIGERIMVSDLPATRVLAGGGQYVGFMRDDSDVVLLSHPSDVKPFPRAEKDATHG
jgi:hypothetical protein